MANARLQVLQPLLKPVFLSTLARSGTGNWIPSIHSSMSSNGGGLSPRPADMLCDAPEASSCPGCCSCCCCGPSKLQVGGGGLGLLPSFAQIPQHAVCCSKAGIHEVQQGACLEPWPVLLVLQLGLLMLVVVVVVVV
eukprot:scaffold86407_cov14-Tisochrysis_lutea.AAC.1